MPYSTGNGNQCYRNTGYGNTTGNVGNVGNIASVNGAKQASQHTNNMGMNGASGVNAGKRPRSHPGIRTRGIGAGGSNSSGGGLMAATHGGGNTGRGNGVNGAHFNAKPGSNQHFMTAGGQGHEDGVVDDSHGYLEAARNAGAVAVAPRTWF
jgi:hypothetical protein